MPTSLPSRVAIAPDVLYQVLEGESVLLNLKTEHYYSLDEIGTRMWQLLDEHGDPTTVVEQLLAEYDADEATLRQDLADLIGKLSQAGLVTIG